LIGRILDFANMAHRRPAYQLPPSARHKEAPGTTEKIDCFLTALRPNLPCLVIDLDVVRARHSAFRTSFPDATLFYTVKPNPAAEAMWQLMRINPPCRTKVFSH